MVLGPTCNRKSNYSGITIMGAGTGLQKTRRRVRILGRVAPADCSAGAPTDPYMPSVVANQDVVYAIGGGHRSVAGRAGGGEEVTETQGPWRKNKGSNV